MTRPTDAATRGFLRGTARDRGYERVAKFLLLQGAGPAARVLAGLTEGEAIGIVSAIAGIRFVGPHEARRILDEFGYRLAHRELLAHGGRAAARIFLAAAVGDERADELWAQVRAPLPPAADQRQPEHMVAAVSGVPVATAASIVARLPARLGGAVLERLRPARRDDLAYRIAESGAAVPAPGAQQPEASSPAADAAGAAAPRVDGPVVLSGMLAHVAPPARAAMLDALERRHAGLADEVRRGLLCAPQVPERLLPRVAAADLRRLLSARTDRQVALLLAGAAPPVGRLLRAHLPQDRLPAVHRGAPPPPLACEEGGALLALVEEVERAARAGTITLNGAAPC